MMTWRDGDGVSVAAFSCWHPCRGAAIPEQMPGGVAPLNHRLSAEMPPASWHIRETTPPKGCHQPTTNRIAPGIVPSRCHPGGMSACSRWLSEGRATPPVPNRMANAPRQGCQRHRPQHGLNRDNVHHIQRPISEETRSTPRETSCADDAPPAQRYTPAPKPAPMH